MAYHRPLHAWTLDPAAAVELQRELASQVVLAPPDREIRVIAGGDISFDRGSEMVHAGFVVVRLSDMATVETKGVLTPATFPYIPGLLSFREIPALLEAWSLLEIEPDAVMIDGHGYSHPRRFGIASHFGVLVDRPTVGCAKTVLVGRYEQPGPKRGDWTPLVHRKEVIGAALRTREGVSPIFASVGNRLDLASAIDLTLACGGGIRIPEPTRRAHLFVNQLRRAG